MFLFCCWNIWEILWNIKVAAKQNEVYGIKEQKFCFGFFLIGGKSLIEKTNDKIN